jgi:hypothetical protein
MMSEEVGVSVARVRCIESDHFHGRDGQAKFYGRLLENTVRSESDTWEQTSGFRRVLTGVGRMRMLGISSDVVSPPGVSLKGLGPSGARVR